MAAERAGTRPRDLLSSSAAVSPCSQRWHICRDIKYRRVQPVKYKSTNRRVLVECHTATWADADFTVAIVTDAVAVAALINGGRHKFHTYGAFQLLLNVTSEVE
jgi:hypothetical protein